MSSDKPAATPEPAEQLTGVIRDAPAGVAEELGEPVPLWAGADRGGMRYRLLDSGTWQYLADKQWKLVSYVPDDTALQAVGHLAALLRDERAAHEKTKRAAQERYDAALAEWAEGCREAGQREQAAERRASEAEARAANLHEALLSVKRRTVADGLPCWCEQFTERRGDVAYSGVHGPICKAAREALAAKEPTT